MIGRKTMALYNRFYNKLLGAATFVATILMTTQTVYASTGSGGGKDIWQWLEGAISEVYGKVLGLSTIGFCLAMAVALMFFYFSKDERQVASARSWIKQIIAAFVIINVLGYIVTTVVNLTDGGKYTV
jgi:hypothetical protein